MVSYHQPVLLKEVLGFLNIKTGKWYLDCTLGDGGYTIEILKLKGNVIGLDVDPEALERAKERLEELGGIEGLGNYELIKGNFRDLKNLVGGRKFTGILFDLGVSSLQLDDPKRGFSFIREGPLDMRMDPNLEVNALDLINALNKGELYELFSKLGEEKFAKTIAADLVLSRSVTQIRTTTELARMIEKSIRKRGKIHPATKVFQALRIAVNDELNVLQQGLLAAFDVLANGGNIVVISFHSLEDRIIKNTFKNWQEKGLGKTLGKPIIPTSDEIFANARSRSSKLRIFTKI